MREGESLTCSSSQMSNNNANKCPFKKMRERGGTERVKERKSKGTEIIEREGEGKERIERERER